MKINKIKKQKNGKYELKLDNNVSIVTYDKVILDNNLLFESSLDLSKLSKINEENNYYDIYNKLIKMINKKLRSEKEIYDFLMKINIEEKTAIFMIEKLKENGFINDQNFVRAFIHDKINFSNDGPNKIRVSLLNYGVEDNLIDEEIKKIDKDIFLEKRKKIIHKRINQNNKYSKNYLYSKIKNELLQLGYDLDDFETDLIIDNDDEILQKEIKKLYKKLSLKYENDELKYHLCYKLIQKGFSKDKIFKCMEKLENVFHKI